MTENITESPTKILAVVLLLFAISVSSCRKSPPPDTKEPDAATGSVTDIKTSDIAEPKTRPVGESDVPIPIELPRPMFVGTPQNIQGVSKLAKPLGKARPPFLAPPGTENVASAKPISSTDEEPIIGEIEYITDGDKSAADGSYVELGPFVQHITIDLGAEYDIYAVLFWHYHKQARVYFDVIVQVASDPDFITGVATLYNNDDDNSAGLGVGRDMHFVETNEGKLVDAKGTRGRYVRLYSNGSNANDLNHYIEVEVFGKPTK